MICQVHFKDYCRGSLGGNTENIASPTRFLSQRPQTMLAQHLPRHAIVHLENLAAKTPSMNPDHYFLRRETVCKHLICEADGRFSKFLSSSPSEFVMVQLLQQCPAITDRYSGRNQPLNIAAVKKHRAGELNGAEYCQEECCAAH